MYTPVHALNFYYKAKYSTYSFVGCEVGFDYFLSLILISTYKKLEKKCGKYV